MGLAAGVAIVAVLGAVTMWSMNSARREPQPVVTNAQRAPAPAAIPVGAPVDRKSAVPGTRGAVRVDLVARRSLKKNSTHHDNSNRVRNNNQKQGSSDMHG